MLVKSNPWTLRQLPVLCWIREKMYSETRGKPSNRRHTREQKVSRRHSHQFSMRFNSIIEWSSWSCNSRRRRKRRRSNGRQGRPRKSSMENDCTTGTKESGSTRQGQETRRVYCMQTIVSWKTKRQKKQDVCIFLPSYRFLILRPLPLRS